MERAARAAAKPGVESSGGFWMVSSVEVRASFPAVSVTLKSMVWNP